MQIYVKEQDTLPIQILMKVQPQYGFYRATMPARLDDTRTRKAEDAGTRL